MKSMQRGSIRNTYIEKWLVVIGVLETGIKLK